MERISDEQLKNTAHMMTNRGHWLLTREDCAEIVSALRELLALREESKWIAVTKKLPPWLYESDGLKSSVAVLATIDGEVFQADYQEWTDSERSRFNGWSAGEGRFKGVTHWRPLPAPPTEDTDGG